MALSALSTAPLTVLAPEQWQPLAQAHAARVDAVTAARRERAARGEPHAVDDFMYDYYSTKPRLLRRWHPGPGVVLEGAGEHATWRWYAADASGTWLDAHAFLAARGATVDFVARLMSVTAGRPAMLGCFGLHEWAMVYREGERRHELPLRLGAEGTDAVVEANALVCSHYDAFRFFTPDAVPRNDSLLTRESQVTREQPGCLHANMDLFKWCAKLSPAIPSELQQDCFEFAAEVRRVDMRASPYDVSAYELDAIRIEEPAGKAEYAALQRDFAARASVLRERIVAACDATRAAAAQVSRA